MVKFIFFTIYRCQKGFRIAHQVKGFLWDFISNIWRDQRLSLCTKTRIYQTLVVSVLLYASETWTLLAADVKTLEAYWFIVEKCSISQC